MKLLRDIVLRTVPVVEPERSLADVLAMIAEESLQTVVIVGDGMYMGVFTPDDRDSGRIPAGVDRANLAVGSYANGLRFVGSPSMSVADARELIVKHNLRAMPVVAGRIYKGVVTPEDLM
ncbi:MAG: CBS domain-containing protein [Armatimonadetes bacterium]|nr:CBS domain-containing protein [Armatimonadota bacterium]